MAAPMSRGMGGIQSYVVSLSILFLAFSLAKFANTPTYIPEANIQGKSTCIEYGVFMSPSVDLGTAQFASVKLNLTVESLSIDKPSRPRCHLLIILSLVTLKH